MKREFKLKNFKLDYPDPSVFTTSPWLSPLIFITYRAIIAIYVTIWSILGVVGRLDAGLKWFIFLTNWSYTFLNVHFIVGTVLPIYYHYVYTHRKIVASDPNANETSQKPEIQMEQMEQMENGCADKPNLRHSRMLIQSCKASWMLFNIAANVGPLVTLMYWGFDYIPGQYVDGSNANAHSVNAILITIDVLLSNAPFRVFHLIYPVSYGMVYVVFTVIYWAVGGTNHQGKPYIYAIMDYDHNAGLAILMAAMFVFLALPLSQFLLYGLYRFRVWLLSKRHNRTTSLCELSQPAAK